MLKDMFLRQWSQGTFCDSQMDNPMSQNLLVGAIFRNHKDKDNRWAFCLRRHFAIVNTNAQWVAGAGEHGTHWFVVAFDVSLLHRHIYIVYAPDPM